MDKLELIQNDPTRSSTSTLHNDALSVLFGREKGGRIRGIDSGVSMTQYAILKENEDSVASMEEKYESMQNQITDLVAIVHLLVKNQATRTPSEDQSNAHLVSSPMSVTNLQNKKSKMLDWIGSGEVVAEGHWCSNEPKEFVNYGPLGPNAVKVCGNSQNSCESVWK